MVPGSNLLKQALRIISRQTVIYYQYSGRTSNAIGNLVASYLPPQDITGSLQAVPRNVYQQYGLDFQSDYVTFYSDNNILDIKRDVSADVFQYNGNVFKCLSNNDWFAVDGWVGVLAIRTQEAAPDPDQFVVTPGTVYIVTPQQE